MVFLCFASLLLCVPVMWGFDGLMYDCFVSNIFQISCVLLISSVLRVGVPAFSLCCILFWLCGFLMA